MKCDELKVYVPQDGPYGLKPEEGGEPVEEETCYLKSDVDAAIAELKAQVNGFENRANLWEYNAQNEHNAAVAVRMENKKLKQKLQDQCISCPVKMQEDDVVAELKKKLEDAKATAYAESVDAGMENRRLKRALWLARAYRGRDNSILLPSKFMRNVWDNVERKCLKKAEQYK